MSTEERIYQVIDDYWAELMKFRGRYHLQKPIRDKLAQYFQKAFDDDPQLLVKLFWRDFERPEIELQPNSYGHIPPYYHYFILAILNKPNPYGTELACQLLRHPKQERHEDCARYLYDAKDPIAIPYLVEALKSADYGIVREAALALGNIGDPKAEPYLLDLVDKYDNDEVYSEDRIDNAYLIIRSSAFNALCLLNSPGAQRKILETLFYDRDISIQERAIRHLVSAMPEQAIPYLEQLTKHKNQRIATVAQEFLEQLNSPDAQS